MICEPNEREGQLLINDERLRINDSVHTDDTDECPQADGGGERE